MQSLKSKLFYSALVTPSHLFLLLFLWLTGLPQHCTEHTSFLVLLCFLPEHTFSRYPHDLLPYLLIFAWLLLPSEPFLTTPSAWETTVSVFHLCHIYMDSIYYLIYYQFILIYFWLHHILTYAQAYIFVHFWTAVWPKSILVSGIG